MSKIIKDVTDCKHEQQPELSKLKFKDELSLLDDLRETLNEIIQQHEKECEGVSGWQLGLALSQLDAIERQLKK